MQFDFNAPAVRQGNGNMKGELEAALPPETVLLYGAEMDFPTAPCIRSALADFAQNGLYGFTLCDTEYRSAVCSWMKRVRNWSVEAEHIVPTHGTVFGLCTALRAFSSPGDGVIILHPSYHRFDNAVQRNARIVVSCVMKECDGIYSIDFTDLEEKMSRPENKLLILINPHNPTGKVYIEAELRQLAALAEKYNIIVFSDEIFAETAQPGHAVLPYVIIDPKRGITSTSLGKAFNFTGVNHANLIIPNPDLRSTYITQRDKDHFGSIDPFFYTALRVAYTEEGFQWIQAVNAHTRRNYQFIADTLAEKLPLLSLSPLDGTFVAWMDCRKLGLDDRQLKDFMEQNALLFADPGEEYGPGGNGFYRLNLATSTQQIETMLTNLNSAVMRRFG